MKLRRLSLLLLSLCLAAVFVTVPAEAAEGEYISYEEAVEVARQGLAARQEVITVYVQSETDLGSSACYELYDLAIAHTGVPNEGDYLRRNMSGCSYDTETTIEDGIYYYTFTLTPNWLSTAEQEAEVDAAVDALLNELALWDVTNYEKIQGVYNWVTENVQYDFDNLDDDSYTLKYSTYSAIVQKNTVCQGYATLVYRLLLSLDVDCRLISGMADGENHAWNIVYLDGKYYNVDATWDRDLMGHYRYFLCTEDNFGDHTRSSEFNTADFHTRYPMALVPYVFNVTASGTVNANIAWVLDGDTGTLTVAGTGTIPSYRYSYAPWYDYRESVKSIVVSEGITEVGERAFYWCTNCTSVTLPSSLTAIREYGFNNLRALQYITLPENLQIIEFCAFSECAALKSITLPDSVHTVESSAFSNCPALTSATLSAGMTKVPNSMFFNDTKLRTVVIPEGITAIGDTVFSNSALRSFHFPATLVTLGSSVFGGCSYLNEYTVAEGNPSFKAVNGVLFTADGKTLLSYPGAKYGSYTVPEGTEYIASSAFRGSDVTSINFGTTLKEIGNYSFSYCTSLTSVTFPSNVTKICDSAFRSCTYLRNIYFQNDSVTIEPGGVFAECDSLVSITLPANLSEIPGYLFYGCAKLKYVTIPDTATRIGSSAFLDCDSLVSITVPGSVKSIGQQAFDFCNKLETIILEEGVQTLGWISIRNAPALERVVLPDSLTRIEQPSNASSRMFDDCPNLVVEVNCGTYGYNYVVNNGIDYTASHPYTVSQVISPTCSAQGYTRYSCKCGSFSYTEDYVSALGHDYHTSVTAPTCTEWGYTTYTCMRCGEWYEDYDVEPNGHSYDAWYVITAPTCLEDGTLSRECTVCGHTETGIMPATGHTPGEPVKENEGAHGSHDLVTYCETCGEELSREYNDGYLPGDINGDGSVNNKDVTRLHRYLTDYAVEVVEDALDVNGDGSVNNKDLTRLFRYLSGYEVELH